MAASSGTGCLGWVQPRPFVCHFPFRRNPALLEGFEVDPPDLFEFCVRQKARKRVRHREIISFSGGLVSRLSKSRCARVAGTALWRSPQPRDHATLQLAAQVVPSTRPLRHAHVSTARPSHGLRRPGAWETAAGVPPPCSSAPWNGCPHGGIVHQLPDHSLGILQWGRQMASADSRFQKSEFSLWRNVSTNSFLTRRFRPIRLNRARLRGAPRPRTWRHGGARR